MFKANAKDTETRHWYSSGVLIHWTKNELLSYVFIADFEIFFFRERIFSKKGTPDELFECVWPFFGVGSQRMKEFLYHKNLENNFYCHCYKKETNNSPDITLLLSLAIQNRIQNLMKHLRFGFLQKQLSSSMLDSVVNMSLY